MNLVVVESPTKARKLKSYLGSEYQVEASVGHVRDLPKSGLNIDVKNNFEPTYKISPDKQKVIDKLAAGAKKANKIFLATDPDREGEAIAWHVRQVLEKTKKITGKKFLRATFHEITKPAVTQAINNPGKINMDLVDAQQARRVVDRLVGYEVSPVLWRKIRRGLSAGRVQSVALRLIVEREREIEAFVPEEYWEVDVALSTEEKIAKTAAEKVFREGKVAEELPPSVFIGRVVEINGKNFAPKTADDVTDLRDVLPKGAYQVKNVEKKERRRASLPPFTTSTLQQRAATGLGLSGKQTMRLAQDLYEEGLITYHRTDSVALSSASLEMARNYIKTSFSERYLPASPRYFSQQSKNAQEAHEAIRVTDVRLAGDDILKKDRRFTRRHVQLYDLIWRRFIASQMESAVYDQTTILTECTPSAKNKTKIKTALLRTAGSILIFDGWMKLFKNGDDVILPPVEIGQALSFVADNFAQKYTQPPARYNDASLIKTLEKLDIGRPSTYASIISVIEERGYVEKRQKRFYATPIGMTVTDFLMKHFKTLMDYQFTAGMEEDLDRIARGERVWHKVVDEFYRPFHKTVEEVIDEAKRMTVPVEKTGEKCPECGDTEGGEVVIRSGRFGKFKSCSRYPDCKFTQNIVDLVEGVKCPLCKKGDVAAKQSRWGKPFFGCTRYPDCDWASWKQPQPGETLTPKQWAVMQAKREERKKKWAERNNNSNAGKTTNKKKTGSRTASKKASKSTKTKSKSTKTKKATSKAAPAAS